MLRSGKELESPKGTSEIEVEKEKQTDKGLISLPHESEIEKKEVEKEKEKETKSIPPKPYMPLFPFLKDLLGLNLSRNMASFLEC